MYPYANERETLCQALLRFLESTEEHDEGDKAYLIRLVKRVQQHGSGVLDRHTEDREAFTDLVHLATL